MKTCLDPEIETQINCLFHLPASYDIAWVCEYILCKNETVFSFSLSSGENVTKKLSHDLYNTLWALYRQVV